MSVDQQALGNKSTYNSVLTSWINVIFKIYSKPNKKDQKRAVKPNYFEEKYVNSIKIENKIIIWQGHKNRLFSFYFIGHTLKLKSSICLSSTINIFHIYFIIGLVYQRTLIFTLIYSITVSNASFEQNSYEWSRWIFPSSSKYYIEVASTAGDKNTIT